MNKARVKINQDIAKAVKEELESFFDINEKGRSIMATLSEAVAMEIEELEKNQKAFETKVTLEVERQAKALHQTFSLSRSIGMQLEALVRTLDKAAPGLRKGFDTEFQKTVQLVAFLDKLNHPGELSGKPIRERLIYIRTWNVNPENIPIVGSMFGMGEILQENKDNEFTQEEREALQVEFGVA